MRKMGELGRKLVVGSRKLHGFLTGYKYYEMEDENTDRFARITALKFTLPLISKSREYIWYISGEMRPTAWGAVIEDDRPVIVDALQQAVERGVDIKCVQTSDIIYVENLGIYRQVVKGDITLYKKATYTPYHYGVSDGLRCEYHNHKSISPHKSWGRLRKIMCENNRFIAREFEKRFLKELESEDLIIISKNSMSPKDIVTALKENFILCRYDKAGSSYILEDRDCDQFYEQLQKGI